MDDGVVELRVHGRGGVVEECSARSAAGLRRSAGWELVKGLLDEGELAAIGAHGRAEAEEVVLRRFAGVGDDGPDAALDGSGLVDAVARLLGDLEDERGLRCRPEPRELAIDEDDGLRYRPEPRERANEVDDISIFEQLERAPAGSSTNGQDVTLQAGESF